MHPLAAYHCRSQLCSLCWAPILASRPQQYAQGLDADATPELGRREGVIDAPGLPAAHRLDDRSADERGRIAVQVPPDPDVIDHLVEVSDRPADTGCCGKEG